MSFSADILPLFEAECASCHGVFGGWSVDDYGNVMRDGNSGPAVVPGDPEGSLVVQLLRHPDRRLMPPAPAGPLAAHEIQLVVGWIAAGAPDN